MVLPRALLSEDSPFVTDARWKKQYDDFTTVSQSKILTILSDVVALTYLRLVKAKEHEALREAVRTENMRIQTLDAQNQWAFQLWLCFQSVLNYLLSPSMAYRNQLIDVRAFPPDHFEENVKGIDWKRVSAKVLLPCLLFIENKCPSVTH